MDSGQELLRERLAPMGVGEILGKALRLLGESFLTLVGLVAVLQVPLAICLRWLSGALTPDLSQHQAQLHAALDRLQHSSTPDLSTLGQPLGQVLGDLAKLLALVLSLDFVVSGIIGGALAVAISERYSGHPVDLFSCYRAVVTRLLPLVGTLIAVSITLTSVLFVPVLGAVLAGSPSLGVVAFMVSIVAFVYMGIRWALVAQVAALGPPGAWTLRMAWNLTAGAWWKTFGVLALSVLLALAVTRLFGIAESRLATVDANLAFALSVPVAIVTRAYVFCAQAVLCLDLGLRDRGALM